MKKVAIVIGHAPDRKGSCSNWVPCEFTYNKKVAEELKKIDPNKYIIFEHDTYKYGYTSMIQRTANKINSMNFDLVLELHYNSATPTATGCEILYYYLSVKGKQYAEIFSFSISQTMNVRNRGSKPLTKKDRGYEAVARIKPVALILEPFFGTNKEDCKKFEDEKIYAMCIDKIISSL